uniref:Ig-like domain-containing protein n=1 Tax=Dicentrarchus labrax TaxID=13489 RepID=A0A8C4GUG7_DICLA
MSLCRCFGFLLFVLHSLPGTTGHSVVVNISQPIVAIVGEDTILPCHLDPAVDPASTTLEWSRPDQGHRFVHVRHEGEDALTDQNPSYKGRTSVSNNTLKQGDVSLKLSRVELSDNGTYRCYIPKLNKESFISLAVGDMPPPAHKIVLVVAIPIMILSLIVVCLTCDKRADDAEGSGSRRCREYCSDCPECCLKTCNYCCEICMELPSIIT